MSKHEQFTGKTVLVTGGSRGIGAAVVRRFAALGARVAIGYRTRADAAKALVTELSAAGTRVSAFQADLARPEDIDRLVQEVVAVFGVLDIVVNSAGIAPYRPLGSFDAVYIRELFDANVTGAFLLTQAVVPHLVSPGGRIIHFSSRIAFSPIPSSSVYAATKAAVATLTHALSKELGPKGITINAVAPGVIATEMSEQIIRERGEAIRAATPLGRIGIPEDIACIVTFLASPDAGWITGRTILADGGLT